MIEELIFDTLKDIVGNKVYPDVVPQNASLPLFPCIIYTLVGSQNPIANCGNAHENNEMVRVQLDLFAETAKIRANLRLLVRKAMDEMSHCAVLQSGILNLYEPETKTYRAIFDYHVYLTHTIENMPIDQPCDGKDKVTDTFGNEGLYTDTFEQYYFEIE